MGFRPRSLVPLLLLLAVLLMVTPASGARESGTVHIDWGEHVAILLELGHGANTIDWTIEVVQGPPVDVFFLPVDGYREFSDVTEDEFSYYTEGTALQVNRSDECFEWRIGIAAYVVIDNSEVCGVPDEMVTTQVRYDILYTSVDSPEEGASDDDAVWVMLCMASAIGVGLIVVVFLFRLVKAKPTTPPIPRYPPAYAPYPPPGGPPPPAQYPPRGPPAMAYHGSPQHPRPPPAPYSPGGPPPQAYRARPPPPPPPQPPPFKRSVYQTEDTTYIVEESPSMAMDTTDLYAEQLAQQNRDRKRFGRY